jgi:hypothetical protein
MQTVALVGVTTWLTVVAVSPAHAQNVTLGGGSAVPRTSAGGAAPIDRQQRYRITTMERVLEGAVEHGASITRDRLRSVLPADMLLSENASARGFRLDDYGVFFDVAVPSLEGTLAWMLPVLRQNNANLENALRTVQSFIESAGPNDNVQQAFKRLASQVSPVAGGLIGGDSLAAGGPATLVGQSVPGGPSLAPAPSVSAPAAAASADPGADRIMENPQEAYRAEVRDALMDVMLDHSRSLNLAAEEWLTVAARSNEARPSVAPMDNQSQTVIIRVRGVDLNAYLAGQISREDARKRMDVRVF